MDASGCKGVTNSPVVTIELETNRLTVSGPSLAVIGHFEKVTMVLVVVLVQLPQNLATSNYHHKQKRATGHFPLSRHWTRPLAFPVFRPSGFGGAEGFFPRRLGGKASCVYEGYNGYQQWDHHPLGI